MKSMFKKLRKAVPLTFMGLAALIYTGCNKEAEKPKSYRTEGKANVQVVAGEAVPTTNVHADEMSSHKTTEVPLSGMRYAIVAKNTIADDINWKQPLTALQQRYAPNTKTFTFTNSLDEVRPALASYHPTHVDWIARPEEVAISELPHLTDMRSLQEHLRIGAESGVGQFNSLLTQLDSDTYRDAIGGIITGATAADALKLAQAKSFTIETALLKTLGEDENLAAFPSVIAYSDGRPENNKVVKRERRGSTAMKKTLLDFAGPEFLEQVNSGTPQLIVTSGHANYMNWECGWNYPDTRFVVGKNAALYAVSPSGSIEGLLQSTNQKAYWGAGNCQSARIKNPEESLALSWIHSGNVVQFVGYTLDTWHGFIGWNLRHAFLSSERPTIAEALTQMHIAAEHERQRLETYRKKHMLAIGDHEFGKIYDQAAVVLYGSSALSARVGVENATPLFEKELHTTRTGTTTRHRCTFRTLRDKTEIQAPVVYLLPQAYKNAKVVHASAGLDYKVIDNAVIFNTSDIITEQGTARLKPRSFEKGTHLNLELETQE